jgi:hypothetical protein
MVCRFILHCTLVFVYQIEVVQNHRQKEILHIKANDLPPLVHFITWPSAILQVFLRIDAVFTDLGKAFTNALMHVKLILYLHCICTTENANKFSINCKMTKLNKPILCAYGTRVLLSGSLVILKNAVNSSLSY